MLSPIVWELPLNPQEGLEQTIKVAALLEKLFTTKVVPKETAPRLIVSLQRTLRIKPEKTKEEEETTTIVYT